MGPRDDSFRQRVVALQDSEMAVWWLVGYQRTTRSDVCNEPIIRCGGAGLACTNACSNTVSGRSSLSESQWSECSVWLCGRHALHVSLMQGQTGCRCELRNVALLTLSCTKTTRLVASSNGYVQYYNGRYARASIICRIQWPHTISPRIFVRT
jgi:hypothetical protein